MSDEKVYLKHILEYIRLIEKFTEGVEKKDFLENEEKQLAITRGIEIIGEAVKQLSNSLKDNYPSTPWKDIAGTRDVLIHAYFSVDLHAIWKIIHDDLPQLKSTIQNILKDQEK